MARTLILMRHGKSAYPDGVDDHQRPLAPRGRRQAGMAGRWLQETQPPIDAVRCSTATRTRETLAALGVTAPVVFDAAIYEARPATLIELIQLADDDVATLLLIGHAPGMPQTAWELASNRDCAPAIELSGKFPTSALAILRFDGSWSDVAPAAGELLHFHIPR
ncbi:histidine phosphatase family protein [Nocardia sp. CNY236]|uniref:SixA phosphatase family protein n=1 Tax=Nocardia sp. CNY236 TaxID=1169152 RepID=UPI0003FC961E|nr:histidine phosphatase family protein [Nocardia sp. CNY236]